MYISTEIGSCTAFKKDKKAILRVLKDAGFTAYDFSMFDGFADEILLADDYLQKAKELREYADSIGLPCNQSHAPFATARKGDVIYNQTMFPKVVRAIEVSGILGVKVCVVHPCNDYTAEENAELYKSFEPYARKAGVKIGVENMWNWESGAPTAKAAACSHHFDFKKHLALLPEDVFVACLDIGHAEMAGLDTSAPQMIRTLGKRLHAIHLHDNDRVHDNHAVPFTYKVDFAEVIKALKEVGYGGDITLETNLMSKVPPELIPAAAKYCAETAKYFKAQLEK